jgi:hypothetical protein
LVNGRKVVHRGPRENPFKSARPRRNARISDTIQAMAIPTVPIENLILQQLAQGEMRLLALVVAVRKSLGRSEAVKGDLSTIVKSSLRKLVASNAVVDMEGVFALRSHP